MLARYTEILRTALFLGDAVLVSGAWLLAYGIRFHTELGTLWFGPPVEIPDFGSYALVLALILPTWTLLFRSQGLYGAHRTGSWLRQGGAILRATGGGILVMVAATFFLRSYFYSRAVIGLFGVLSVVSIALFRMAVDATVHELRRRGVNVRNVLVVGAGALAEHVIDRIRAHPESGLRVAGAVSDDRSHGEGGLLGVPILARYSELKQVLGRLEVDQVILALPKEESHHLEKVMTELDDQLVNVRLIPDLLHVLTLRSSVDELDGLPVINLREGPLVGWAAVQKRIFDIVVTTGVLIGLAPVLVAIAAAVAISMGRPVFYRQERMGLDGQVFPMFKFRTMILEAESETGPVWTSSDDPRRTRLGAFLRRTSLDELPQLWNVLRGDMSLVGPRPERPVFIEKFRREIPGYMLRHKVKSGLTGWAQVHGWRGDTSLHERIEHDIFYIQNWSLGLDIRILLMTLWRGWIDRNAY